MFASLARTAFSLSLATAATIVIIAGSAAPVQAADAPRTARISTDGIDLTSTAGRARVEAQINRAARAVCGANDAQAWKQAPAIRTCMNAAIANAQPRIEALAVAARDARTTVAGVTPATARP